MSRDPRGHHQPPWGSLGIEDTSPKLPATSPMTHQQTASRFAFSGNASSRGISFRITREPWYSRPVYTEKTRGCFWIRSTIHGSSTPSRFLWDLGLHRCCLCPILNSYPDPPLSLSLLAQKPYIMKPLLMVEGGDFAHATVKLSSWNKRKRAG